MDGKAIRRLGGWILLCGSLAACGQSASGAEPNLGATAVVRSANATNTALAKLAAARPTEAPSTSPQPSPTPKPRSRVVTLPPNYKFFSSSIHSYTLGYPRDWTARGDAFRYGKVSGDTFSAPPAGDLEISISIVSIPMPGSSIRRRELQPFLDQLVEAATKNYKGAKHSRVKVAGGVPGRMVVAAPIGQMQESLVIWVMNRKVWYLSLTSPASGHDVYIEIANKMLSTFDLEEDTATGDGVVN